MGSAVTGAWHHRAMTVWAVLALGFAAAFVAAMVAAARGRSTKFVGSLAGLIALACGWVWWSDARMEARLSEAASAVAGVQVHVDCQELFFGEWMPTRGAGRVDARDDGSMDDVAHLDRKICTAAASWPEDDTDDAYTAVHVLTHEAGHVRGEANEAATECWAVQNSARVAEALGASRPRSERRAQWYLRAVFPRMSSTYRGDGCTISGS